MSVTRVLLDILIVLLAAKLATEGAERIGAPAVVGEIIAGVLIGPSVLGLVHADDDVLRVLGELGVILLLLDVGLEMDIGELAAVGRAALAVATIGVVVPLVAGMGAATALGMSGTEALFVGAALTATSVGITARVFGDLRMLATAEARTVLGAAVADDVMGLVILTVVTRIASQGTVSAGTVATVVVVAVGFLVVAAGVGIRVGPWLFEHIGRISRSPGTVVALSLVFTLGMAELANAAKLAPIVGAFVAGLSLSRGQIAPRVRRELTPVGHLLIPVFFLQIGIDADIGQLAKARVLAIAGILIVVAVAGKVVSMVGAGGSGDRLLVGLAMIPRGEVGLIFATLGLSQGILGDDLYASLLLVVLVTTLVTPALLTWRVRQRQRRTGPVEEPREAPPGGWLTIDAGPAGAVELVAEPDPADTVETALRSALAVGAGHRAGDRLVRWLSGLPADPPWDEPSRRLLFRFLAEATAPAWRFLLVSGGLDRVMPELADALRHRQQDPFETDPNRSLSWPRLEQVNRLALDEPGRADLIRLAAVLLDAGDAVPDLTASLQLVEPVADRLALDDAARADLTVLVGAASLLPAAARRLDGLDEEPVVQLASHLGTAERAEAAWIVASTTPATELERDRLAALRQLVSSVLAHPEHTGVGSDDLVARRKAEAAGLIPDAWGRISATPRAFVLSQAPADLARQAALADPPLPRNQVRAAVTPNGDGTWRVDVALADRVGLLAHQLDALRDEGLRVLEVATVVWPDRQSLSSFRVEAERRPNSDRVADAIAATLPAPVAPLELPGAVVSFDDESSPWHTVCTVVNDDRSAALGAVAHAVALCELNVVAARAGHDGDRQLVVLELVDRNGGHPGHDQQERVRTVLATGQQPPSLRQMVRRRPR